MSDSKTKLIKMITYLIFNDKNPAIYIQSPEYSYLKNKKELNIVNDCEKAVILVIENYNGLSTKCLKNHPVIFVTKYSTFKENKISLGTVFWQKGRLNIIFRKERLKDFSVSLPKQYNKYIE